MTDSGTRPFFALLKAAGAVEERVDARLATVGLSVPKLAALHQLALAGESLPLGQLAERLACVKSNVTQLIDRLEVDGFVSRAPDPGDRRSRLAVLTPSGRAAYEDGMRIQQQAERDVFGALSADESQQLSRLVAKLHRA